MGFFANWIVPIALRSLLFPSQQEAGKYVFFGFFSLLNTFPQILCGDTIINIIIVIIIIYYYYLVTILFGDTRFVGGVCPPLGDLFPLLIEFLTAWEESLEKKRIRSTRKQLCADRGT